MLRQGKVNWIQGIPDSHNLIKIVVLINKMREKLKLGWSLAEELDDALVLSTKVTFCDTEVVWWVLENVH